MEKIPLDASSFVTLKGEEFSFLRLFFRRRADCILFSLNSGKRITLKLVGIGQMGQDESSGRREYKESSSSNQSRLCILFTRFGRKFFFWHNCPHV
jgi:hypothetical protein